MKAVDLTILNTTGLHARPAKTFVKLAKKFSSRVQVQYDGKQVNGKSMIGILKLGVKQAGVIRLLVDGEDEDDAITQLSAAIASGLGEGVEHVEPAPATQKDTVQPKTMVSDNQIIGIPASNGVAVGVAWQLVTDEIVLPEGFTSVSAETDILNTATTAARKQIKALHAETLEKMGATEAAIFEAHLELLNDPDLSESVSANIKAGKNAARAWLAGVEANAEALAQLPDPLLAARSADMRDVGQRVLRLLTGQAEAMMPSDPFILLAHDLSPSLTASLDKEIVLGICTATGGPNAHAAILARAYGIPAVVGAGDSLLNVANGTKLIVNGQNGAINLAPSETEIDKAQKQREALKSQYGRALRESADPAITTDGHRVEIVANVGGVADAEEAQKMGAEGVGLLRTEFLFLQRETAPTIAEQTEVYGDILAALQGQPVIIRTLDVGGDKPLPYIDVPAEENPFLGERGIRLCLNRPKLFRDQLTAITQATSRGHARIMFPMVSDLTELQEARKIVDAVTASVGIAPLEIGIMVEVPSAALMADQFAPYVDFFSIGTNDLTQYTLAVDRMHPSLAKLSDGLHPAVLRLIDKTVQAAHAAGKWVGVCGELAADPQAVPILIGLGVDELSVSSRAVPTVKAQIRTIAQANAKQIAQRALACATASAVRQLES